jgi:hypothetical protein
MLGGEGMTAAEWIVTAMMMVFMAVMSYVEHKEGK